MVIIKEKENFPTNPYSLSKKFTKDFTLYFFLKLTKKYPPVRKEK